MLAGLAGDEDFHSDYDFDEVDEDDIDVLNMSGALRVYGRAIHATPNPPKHERALRLLTRTGADGRLKPRVVNCYFEIEASESISLCFSIDGDCGQSSYTRPPVFTYWVAPGDGVVFLYQPSSASIAWLQDGYEFEGPESVSHAPGKAKLGARTAADILWLIAQAGILRQHEFDIYQEAFYCTLRNNPPPPTMSDRPLPGWNYAPRSADGTWDLAAGRRSLEAFITEGLKRRAACAWLLESLYDDARNLWRSFKAAREQVDEMDFCTNIRGPWDKRLQHFADVCDVTPLRKLILQKLGAETPVPRSTLLNLTAFAEWVRSMGNASSFREHVNKVVEDFCVAADQEVEQLPVNMAKFALHAHEQLPTREKLNGIYAAIYPPEARRRAQALRERFARDCVKLTPADLLEIVRRAISWPAPSHIFRTNGTASYSYIFQAPVSIASILMLREANEVARKARETKQTGTAASHPEDVKLPAANEIDSESSSNIDASTEGISSAPTNVGLSGLDRHKMKKKSNQKAAKIAKRLAARAAAVEQPTCTDGAVGNDGAGGAVGEEGGPGEVWSVIHRNSVIDNKVNKALEL